MKLEDEVVEGGWGRRYLRKVLARKQLLLTLSRGLWALRDAVHPLRRASPSFIDRELDARLGQVCVEVDGLAEVLETYKLMASGLINMHATSLPARLNITARDLTLAMLYPTVVATVIGFPNTVATTFGVPRWLKP
jgi:Mg2+ and Co2+ transporter CorA